MHQNRRHSGHVVSLASLLTVGRLAAELEVQAQIAQQKACKSLPCRPQCPACAKCRWLLWHVMSPGSGICCADMPLSVCCAVCLCCVPAQASALQWACAPWMGISWRERSALQLRCFQMAQSGEQSTLRLLYAALEPSCTFAWHAGLLQVVLACGLLFQSACARNACMQQPVVMRMLHGVTLPVPRLC